MPTGNVLNQVRQAFRIPDSIVILASDKFLPPKSVSKQSSPQFSIDNTSNIDDPLSYRSLLNTPVWTNIEFLPGQYETNTPGVFRSFGSSVDGPDRLRYEAVIITVAQAKNIVKTEIQGRNGTVKEYIGLGDYEVTINGIITGTNGKRPNDQIQALQKMLDAPIPIEVASAYLQGFGINYLVVDSYEMGEDEGGYAYQKFSISCLSDIQQELQLSNL